VFADEMKSVRKVKELSAHSSKKLLSQQLPRAQVSSLLENLNLGEEFKARMDEVTLPHLMRSVARASLKLFELALLKSISNTNSPSRVTEREEGDRYAHARIELKVPPIKKVRFEELRLSMLHLSIARLHL
jgi:hypothetical protein